MKYTGLLFLTGLILAASSIGTIEALPTDAGECDWFLAFSMAVLGFVALAAAAVRLRD